LIVLSNILKKNYKDLTIFARKLLRSSILFFKWSII